MDPLLTIQQTADILKVRPKTVHAYVREGKLGCVQLSPRERRIAPEQLKAFIESRTITPPKKIDAAAGRPLTSSQRTLKGGEGKGLSGDCDKAQLRKEMRQWH